MLFRISEQGKPDLFAGWILREPVGDAAEPTSSGFCPRARLRVIRAAKRRRRRIGISHRAGEWSLRRACPECAEACFRQTVILAVMGREARLDIVIFGATGFVGRLVVSYLAQWAPTGVRIGLAGRSTARLAELRERLGPAAAAWPLRIADLRDSRSLRELAESARVVGTTAGPYAGHGLGLVEACVSAGTDYADLAGEVLFMRESIDRYHAPAARAGVKIVHACGVDSIPSDLGVLLLHRRAKDESAGELLDTTAIVRAFRGGLSGGTLATMRRQLRKTRDDPLLRQIVDDPYALSPDRGAEPDSPRERDLVMIRHDPELRVWLAPFVMAGVNTRVVRRSNALQAWAYGRGLRYREATAFPFTPLGLLTATATALGTGALRAAMPSTRAQPLLDRILPLPGQGPDEATRRRGRFEMEIHTRTAAGRRYVARIRTRGDPGYTASSLMLAESALCLALDRPKLPDAAGVLTPATAIGATLADRLCAAGLDLQIAYH